MSKRTRGPNFSQNEKDIIIHLVEKYKDVVENKKTDAVSTSSKNDGWTKLTNEFNSISTFCSRNCEQIKTCWDNIKRTTRKEKAKAKKEFLLTGGGRPNINPPGPLEAKVESLLGPTLDGLENIYDSDIQFLPENDSIIIEVESVTETEPDANKINDSGPSQTPDIIDENLPPDNTVNVWKNWTPSALKTKVSNPLRRTTNDNNINNQSPWLHRRRPRLSLQDKVLQNKIELIEILKLNAQKELDLRSKLLEEQIKQEEIKTKILMLDLENKKKTRPLHPYLHRFLNVRMVALTMFSFTV